MKKKKTEIKKRSLYQKIVNVFISIFIVILFLIFLFFGISQTSSFREYLRQTVVNKVNNSINGYLSISKIEGTLLTSLYLRNAVITSEKDTLLNAETIELKTSPLQLLFKNILIRKLELRNADFKLITYKKGKTNLDDLFKSTEKQNKTKTIPFSFNISAPNVLLNNVRFYHFDNIYANSETVYDSLNTKNLIIKNINASLAAMINLKNNYYELQINSLSCSPNINLVNIKNIKTHIILSNNKLFVDNLQVKTSNSNFVLKGTINKNNLLKAFKNNTYSNASVNLNLKSERLDLGEIGKFIPSILPVDGIVKIDLNSKGSLNNFKFNLLDIGVGKSHLHINGEIANLDNSDSLNIKAKIIKSVLYADEISKELKFLKLPELKGLNKIIIDTISYVGKEFSFNSNFKIAVAEGNISGNVQMNFLNEETNYYGEINTKNVSLSPVLNLPVILNSKIKVFGTSTDILLMNSSVKINANNSLFKNKKLDVLNLSSTIKNGKIIYKIDTVLDSSNVSSNGMITFDKDDKLILDLKTKLTNFNLSNYIEDTSVVTNINLKLNGKGIKDKNGNYSISSNLELNDSYINKTPIKSNSFKINFVGDKDYISNLKINSKQVDADLSGKFNIESTTNIIVDEINSLTNVIDSEINKFNFIEDTTLTLSKRKRIINKNKIISLNNDSLKFFIRFKQFNLQSPFIGSDNVNISGLLKGRITNKKDKIKLSFVNTLDYVKIWGDAGVYFLSDLSLNVNLINNYRFINLSNLTADINLNTKRVFAGNDIKNIKFNYILKKGEGTLNFNSDIEDKFNIKFKGKTLFNDLTSSLKLDKLKIIFNNYLIQNEGLIDISYSNGGINFNKFFLAHGKSKLKISGALIKNENHKLEVSFKNISLNEITNNILTNKKFKNIKGLIELNAKISGSYLSPTIALDLKVKNVSVNNYKFGIVKSEVNYLNKNLIVKLSVIDTLNDFTKPMLSIDGKFPVDLGLDNIGNRVIDNTNATIKMTANNFNLLAVSNFIPDFTNLNGNLNADIIFNGELNDLLPTGKANIKNISFISDYNNIKYNAGLKFNASNGNIKLDSMYISNVDESIDGGVITGYGDTKLKNYKFISPRVYLNGQLKILNKSSRVVSPLVYGDLVVSTQGKAEFILEDNKEYLKAPLLVKKADLTFPQAKPSFKNTRSNFIYKYVADTSQADKDISSFNNLIKLSRQKDSSKTKKKKSSEYLVYDINIKVEDEASIKFVLDKEFNQILNANISGDFQYKTFDGIPRAFGTLTLREGSTLDFLTKTFEAGGSLRFENELTNPYLDVVGIYRDYYYEPTIDSTNTSSQEKEVAVKVKLIGPLQDLNKNFVKTKDNLAVYYGTDNIDKDVPDLTKDASDAIMFIVTGHFTTSEEGFTTQQSNALSGTASSIAGSLIGGLLNSYAGDYIRSVELKQVGAYTKFSLSGKVNKFKYTIGGTTEVFQDIGRTNIRIEYPFFQKFFIRVERKESLTESNLLREMINELGLKYKFEF